MKIVPNSSNQKFYVSTLLLRALQPTSSHIRRLSFALCCSSVDIPTAQRKSLFVAGETEPLQQQQSKLLSKTQKTGFEFSEKRHTVNDKVIVCINVHCVDYAKVCARWLNRSSNSQRQTVCALVNGISTGRRRSVQTRLSKSPGIVLRSAAAASECG